MKHSPQIRLSNARTAYDAASVDCPHWDLSDDHDPQGRECCYALYEARDEYRKARKAGAK